MRWPSPPRRCPLARRADPTLARARRIPARCGDRGRVLALPRGRRVAATWVPGGGSHAISNGLASGDADSPTVELLVTYGQRVTTRFELVADRVDHGVPVGPHRLHQAAAIPGRQPAMDRRDTAARSAARPRGRAMPPSPTAERGEQRVDPVAEATPLTTRVTSPVTQAEQESHGALRRGRRHEARPDHDDHDSGKIDQRRGQSSGPARKIATADNTSRHHAIRARATWRSSSSTRVRPRRVTAVALDRPHVAHSSAQRSQPASHDFDCTEAGASPLATRRPARSAPPPATSPVRRPRRTPAKRPRAPHRSPPSGHERGCARPRVVIRPMILGRQRSARGRPR